MSKMSFPILQEMVIISSSAKDAQLLASNLKSDSVTRQQLAFALGSSLSLPFQSYDMEDSQSAYFIAASTPGSKVNSVKVSSWIIKMNLCYESESLVPKQL